MKFAVLDPDSDALGLIIALLRQGDNELTVFHSSDLERVAELQGLAPYATRIDEWEGVLAGTSQAVLVGCAGRADLRFEQLRRLVLENIPIIFVHPFGFAPLEYHELDMNRQATKTAILPYEPTRNHPAMQALEALNCRVFFDGEQPLLTRVGRIEQITVERQSKDRSRDAILRSFVRDVGLVRRIVGECEKVSALGKLDEAPTLDAPAPIATQSGHLGVQITTKEAVLIRWSIGPVVERVGARATFVGTDGSATLMMTSEGVWTVQVRVGDEFEEAEYSDAGPNQEFIRAAEWLPVGGADDRFWREALADLELVEAVERSMRKGRTVELFHEEASEQGTFHGVMAAGGCLLMMLAIGLAITATVFGRFRFQIANLWPYALLLLLGVFLIMQLLKLVFPAEKKDD